MHSTNLEARKSLKVIHIWQVPLITLVNPFGLFKYLKQVLHAVQGEQDAEVVPLRQVPKS